MHICKRLVKTLRSGQWVVSCASEVRPLETPATKRQDKELRQIKLQYPAAFLAVVDWRGGTIGWSYKVRAVCLVAHLDGDPRRWFKAVGPVRASEKATH